MYSLYIYPPDLPPWKPLIINDKEQVLLKLSMSKNVDQPNGTFQAELAPVEQGGLSWLEIIPPSSYIEIRKKTTRSAAAPFLDANDKGLLKMQGFVISVNMVTDIQGPNVRYSIKGYDLGIFFSKYFALLSNKYLEGNKAGGASLSAEFQQRLVKVEDNKYNFRSLLPAAWETFSNMFTKQISNPIPGIYSFSDGTTVESRWGLSGGNFFTLADIFTYEYPLYTNLFKDGKISFWSIITDWITPLFNDFWMDTSDGVTPISLDQGRSIISPEGFRLYVRSSLDDDIKFLSAPCKKIAEEKLTSIMLQRSCEEAYSVFVTVADGAYNIGGAFSNGIAAYDTEKLNRYGLQMLEAHIKNAYAGSNKRKDQPRIINDFTKPNSIWHAGSDYLARVYGKNDKLLTGTLSGIDINVRVGEVIETKFPVGDGAKKTFMALIQGVSESIDYTIANPAPNVVMNVKRGRYFTSVR